MVQRARGATRRALWGLSTAGAAGSMGNDGWMRVRSAACGAASPTMEQPGRRGRVPIRRDGNLAPSRGRARWLPVSDQDSRASGFEGLMVGAAHDVSIRIAIGAGDGWCLGIIPASNVSMTCMRPPQQGQGLGSVRGSSVGAAVVGSGSGGGGGHLSNSRALAMAAVRLPLARRP